MDFSLSPEQAALQASARRFAREQMAPVAREIEATGEPLSAAWMKRYAELGFLGINVDPAYGGLGLGNLEALLVLEEFAKVSPAIAFPIFESSVGPARAIEHFAPRRCAARCCLPSAAASWSSRSRCRSPMPARR